MEDPGLRPLLPRRLGHRELVALDGLAGAGYALVLFVGSGFGQPGPTGPPTWLVGVVAAAIGLPVALRRYWPWPVFGVVVTATVVGLTLDVVRDSFVAAAFALYLAALRTPRRRREPTVVIAVFSAIGLLGVVLGGPAPQAGNLVGPVLVGCVLLGAAWTVGRAVRERRAYAAGYASRLAVQAATEERLRIARDLHDIVSHTLSMIGVKAGIANHVADTRPQEAREALRVIEATSREALVDMRRMLGLLRTGTDGGDTPTEPEVPAGYPDATPSPGSVAALRRLAERAVAAGVPVELDLTGLEGLPPEVADSVHRIVQEAVTNVVAHGAPARCQVVVAGGEQGVRVEVTDDGRGGRAQIGGGVPGHGLIGMRERVARHGGELTAGPGRDGGFAVSAWIPLQSDVEKV